MKSDSMKAVHALLDNVDAEARRTGRITIEQGAALAETTLRVRIKDNVGEGFGVEAGEEYTARPDSGMTIGQEQGNFTAKLYNEAGKMVTMLHSSFLEVI